MNNKDLSKIVEEFKVNPSKNFDLLYKSIYKTIYVMTFTYMKNKEDTEDLTQEIFIKIYKNINSLKNCNAFNSWMNRIIVNSCYRALENKRKTNGNISIDDDDYFAEYENLNKEEIPEMYLELNEENEHVIEAIQNLPLIISEVVVMYYFQHLKIKQISEILEIEEAAVKSRLFQGRKKLKLALYDFYHGKARIPAIFIGYRFIGKLINGSFGEVTASSGPVCLPKRFNSSSSMVAGGAAAGVAAVAVVAAGIFMFNMGADSSSQTNNDPPVNQIAASNILEEAEDIQIEEPTSQIDNGLGQNFSFANSEATDEATHEVVDDNKGSNPEPVTPPAKIQLNYISLNRVTGSAAYSILTEREFLNDEELELILNIPGLTPIIPAELLPVVPYSARLAPLDIFNNFHISWCNYCHRYCIFYNNYCFLCNHFCNGGDEDGDGEVIEENYWQEFYLEIWDVKFSFSYKKLSDGLYEYNYSLEKFSNYDSLLNIDLDDDGLPDLNIDLDEDGLPDLNIDLDGDGLPDLNVDTNHDGYPDVNIDMNGDWVADLNLL